jgi:hypothetical protein
MRIFGLLTMTVCLPLTGCVVGSGACLFQQPFKHTLSGTIHFKSFSADDQVDTVPVLTVDQTAYIYAPALSIHCLPANDLQLVGWAELPPDIPENTHVEVQGSIFEAASAHQHTPFLINVRNILKTDAPPVPQPPPAAARPDAAKPAH